MRIVDQLSVVRLVDVRRSLATEVCVVQMAAQVVRISSCTLSFLNPDSHRRRCYGITKYHGLSAGQQQGGLASIIF